MNKIFILITLLGSAASYAQTQQTCEEQNQDQTVPQATRQAAINACYQERGRQQNGGGSNNGNNNNRTNPLSTSCTTTMSSSPLVPATPTPAYFTSATGPAVPLAQDAVAGKTALPPDAATEVKVCRGYEYISNRLSSTLAGYDKTPSQDGRIFCERKAGVTADYDSCMSALSMYNNIVVAEAAMQLFQGVQTNNVQNQVQRDVNQRASNGDAQNAAYDAQVKTVNSAKALNEQQAAAYAAAVAALYSKVQSWIKEDQSAFTQKACGQSVPAAQTRGAQNPQVQSTPPTNAPVSELFATAAAVPSRPADCAPAAERAFRQYNGFVFANKQAKGAFTTAAMLYAAKALQAGIKASQLGNIAKKVEEAKKSTEDPYNPATFELCKATPTDPRCGSAGERVAGSGLGDGGFNFGGDFGNNAFTPVPTGDEDLAPTTGLGDAGDNRVLDTNNPFTDQAKIANGILDPAAAASIQPGGGQGGGSSGGGAGAGGGTASLGGGTPGVDDSKKENDIKANKADGKYNIAGGGAFQAIKPMKEENPFGSLFDGKAGGSLEEDRSIASGDIDGRDSGIFAKISKRYSQVQADKRIEAKNLDE